MIRRRIAFCRLSLVAAAVIIVASASALPAVAETLAVLENLCADDKEAPEQRINACTHLIDFAAGITGAQRTRYFGQRANAYAELQEFSLAIDDYDRAIAGKPDDVVAIANRASAYRYLGQHDLAIEDYDRVIRLDPDNAVHFFNRGGAYSELGNYDKAIEDYSRTVELNPDLPPVRMDRANAYVEIGRFDLALEDYTAVIRLVPNSPDAFANRGDAYANLRQFSHAASDYANAILFEPDNDSLYVNLGYAYMDNGQYKESLASLGEALKLDSENIRAQGALAWLFASARDPAYRNGNDALLMAREVVAARREPDYLKTLAAAYVEIGEPENAFTAYKDAMLLGGASVVASYQAYLADRKIYLGPVNGDLDGATEAAIRACIAAGCKLLAD